MSAEKVIPTRVAHAGWTDHGLQGRSLFGELAGRVSLAELVAIAVTGRTVPPDAARLLDDVAAVITVADPRIWPLKITRLVASYGGTMAAYGAANVWQDRARIGFWMGGLAARSLTSLRAALEGRPADDASVEAEVARRLERGEVIAGFGVPFRDEDERMVAFRACVAGRGRDRLEHWRLMDALARAMRTLRGIEPNISLGFGAALLDMGFTPKEIGALAVALGQSNFLANAVEGAAQAPTLLRRLPDAWVRYEGPPPRRSPRAAAADDASSPSG